jgi:hypothetical protein
MLDWRNRENQICAAVAVGFYIFLAWCSWSPGTPPASYQATYAPYQQRTPISSEEPRDFFSGKLTEWLLVASNIFLVASTFMLWKANNRSAGTAERALTELEAPFIVVQINDPGILFPNVQDVSFSELKFCFANYGRTPANILEFTENITTIDVGTSLPAPIDPLTERGSLMPYGVVALPNGGATQEFKTPVVVDFFENGEDDGFLHAPVTKSAYFRGYVRYSNIFGNTYVVGFQFRFDITGGRWLLMGNEKHNYCRRENKSPDRPEWFHPIGDEHSIRNAIFRASTNPRA